MLNVDIRGVDMWITKNRVCIILSVLFIVCIMTAGVAVAQTNSLEFYEGVVVIDAGHGGIDGGVFVEGIKESDINLEISKKLEKELKAMNIKVIQTRKSEKALGDSKRADMKERARIINNSKPDMVVSLHVNKFKDTSRRGVQVFYDDTNKNKGIGVNMQSVLNTHFNNKYCKRTDLVSLGGDYFMTKCSNFPSIIIECGFLSNQEDRLLLQNEQYQTDLAQVIAKGIAGMIEY